jgi:hypothetical protein
MIPKKIFTVWLTDNDTIPVLVAKCIASQHIPEYEHKLITLENCYRNKYIQDAINAKQWGKACDYLRIHYLIEEGGIYLDADVEMLPGKNFDGLLNHHLFAGRENNGFVNTAVLGAEKGSQLLIDHLKEVEEKFKGDDGLYFESSIEIFTPRILADQNATILAPEYFYPYDWQRNTVDIKDFTVCYHHFMKSWKTS